MTVLPSSGLQMADAEVLLGVELVVLRATHAKIFDGVEAAASPRQDVVQLEQRARLTTTAVSGRKGAAIAIAREDLATDGIGDVRAPVTACAAMLCC